MTHFTAPNTVTPDTTAHHREAIPVAVLGAGAWGTALAAAATGKADVLLWARQSQTALEINQTHRNARYLPDIPLPALLAATNDLAAAFDHVTQAGNPGLLVLGTPVSGLTDMCDAINARVKQHDSLIGVIWTCKGLDAQSAKLPHEMVSDALSPLSQLALGVLSGPSFALEVARGLPVALTIASDEPAIRQAATDIFHSDHIRVYSTNDVVGVEVGGALKNIMAIACGVSDGLSLGNNARAALITRGLAEMTRFGTALGAQSATFYGLTGLGDLVLTATGELSRNRQVGLQIGQGKQLSEILAQGLTAEGARCAQAVLQRARKLNISMPITEAVCATLFDNVPPAQAVAKLMARDATEE